ncbi:hypothetical protein EJ05DRAFT_482659 [Pseudovirgaria hyperparasitica]|uniref:DDHD domain-containing protein n=1 Tax=Pseudovirgaria hyperparasitica TaxID=470096 RepID=A0A6A6WG72_9PEZI|nr:uncharacterized protein EJ05DRAFT_482659 [Pseudovirgaria hyperparasitica]KAF2761832.1 hypothetical protein EJ05DRAFT_482659 [Pseudovirgaria hyperparasitica]
MASSHSDEPAGSVARQTNRYLREVLHAPIAPPSINVRYFYTSPLAIDDPLSPLPPLTSTSSSTYNQPPRPFSIYDNKALEKTWLDLRTKLLKHNEELRDEKKKNPESRRESPGVNLAALSLQKCGNRSRGTSLTEERGRPVIGSLRATNTFAEGTQGGSQGSPSSFGARFAKLEERIEPTRGNAGSAVGPIRVGPADGHMETDTPAITGNPFIRAPSRSKVHTLREESSKRRPSPQQADSYNWDENPGESHGQTKPNVLSTSDNSPESVGPSAKVPVGVSRLHNVVMDKNPIRMEPIYWKPVSDVAVVTRGTWFYKNTMLPVETDVANMLEIGYVELKPWTETWADELNSAVEVGAIGEMKILHRLWPENPPPKPVDSRPSTARGGGMLGVQNLLEPEETTPEKERQETVAHACDLIDISTGPEGPDNKASGSAPYGRDGRIRQYLTAGVIYANQTDAYLLRPNLQPSHYYGRRPLANYIRKNHAIGVRVCRGFNEVAWNRMHPPKNDLMTTKAAEGVSTSLGGAPPETRQHEDSAIAQSLRPRVTDLVLVIHGIGQKLSERMESFHFTHAINAFRREVNVEMGTGSVKAHLRQDMGGVMVLPVNWRVDLSFEDGGYRSDHDDPAFNQYTLKDITPETLPSVRNVISDVMLDIPYYLSREHNPKVLAACIGEANRVYRLWCANNPGFSEWGRVHIIGHSLGSVMAVDVLSKQPSRISPHYGNPSTPESELPTSHFAFDTKSLFLCGSPAGFFLLLKNAALLPRHDRDKPGDDGSTLPGVAGEYGDYGCLAVDNIYNIVNPYDPVAYRVNAAVDAIYASSLKQAFIPSASSGWLVFRNPFRSTPSTNEFTTPTRPVHPHLPSNVELETHNFSREEIAEKRAYALNDNGQIDYFMRYGGGALEIQYLTMLGAHSSYWLSRDFVRMIVIEVGRKFGKDGTVPAMRAQKKKNFSV